MRRGVAGRCGPVGQSKSIAVFLSPFRGVGLAAGAWRSTPLLTLSLGPLRGGGCRRERWPSWSPALFMTENRFSGLATHWLGTGLS
jgi:hypothetical protein